MLTFNQHVFSLLCMEALNQAIGIAKTQSALAKAIGCVPQDVNNWLRRGRVPSEYCPAIERFTKGEVTCEMLRPDVDWADRRYIPQKEAA